MADISAVLVMCQSQGFIILFSIALSRVCVLSVRCCYVPILKGGVSPTIGKQVPQSNTCRQQRCFGILKLGVTVTV